MYCRELVLAIKPDIVRKKSSRDITSYEYANITRLDSVEIYPIQMSVKIVVSAFTEAGSFRHVESLLKDNQSTLNLKHITTINWHNVE